jgi:2-dehydropantoate 2-reductase
MLQDVEAGRQVELGALVVAVRDIAGMVGVTTPSLAALYGLTRLTAQVRGLYPGLGR